MRVLIVGLSQTLLTGMLALSVVEAGAQEAPKVAPGPTPEMRPPQPRTIDPNTKITLTVGQWNAIMQAQISNSMAQAAGMQAAEAYRAYNEQTGAGEAQSKLGKTP